MVWQIDLGGEVALITGGTRNIGLATAQALSRAGARVCIWGHTDAGALESALAQLASEGADAQGALVDLRSEDAIVAGFDSIEHRVGPVSILVNNAAVRPYEALTSMSLSAWSEVVDVDLTGAFLTSRELFRRLPAQRRGAIVNIGGVSAYRPASGRAHVIAAKAGIVGLTRALAEEGSGRIRANCVVPGAIETVRQAGQRAARFIGENRSSGLPADVAHAVLPFADPSEQYLTGQTVHVSGGRFMP
jgi:3-oxoacyl-[acyl-carrier protein] reductase